LFPAFAAAVRLRVQAEYRLHLG